MKNEEIDFGKMNNGVESFNSSDIVGNRFDDGNTLKKIEEIVADGENKNRQEETVGISMPDMSAIDDVPGAAIKQRTRGVFGENGRSGVTIDDAKRVVTDFMSSSEPNPKKFSDEIQRISEGVIS